ncbi:condensation domain-containing protein [Streptomyces sp. NPDC002588]|uniref:condensation domain-containing protein n=1 Tax=Streptomyces sp. NPDC002588 TaxID=3154419 RepID=UPI0033166E90
MTGIALSRAPLSWQQESLLKRKLGSYRRPVETHFTIPDALTDDELLYRVRRLMQRETGLRVVDFDLEGVSVADRVVPVVRRTQCDGPQSLWEFITQSRSQKFVWDTGRPLWNLTIVNHQDENGRPSRTAQLLFDHLIADRAAAALARHELETGVEGNPGKGAGGYLDWVRRQHVEFSREQPRLGEASEFWNRYLDGVSPDCAAPLRVFNSPIAQPKGSEAILLSVRVPVTTDRLRAACRASRTTPAVFLLATVAALVADTSHIDDLIVHMYTSGRTPTSSDVLGWLSTLIPIRLHHPGLADFHTAVATARTAWLKALPFQHTPKPYFKALFPDAGSAEGSVVSGPRHLRVNLFRDASDNVSDADFADKREPVPTDTIGLWVAPLATGGFMFRMSGNTSDVDIELLRSFLEQLRDRFVGYIDDAASGRW